MSINHSQQDIHEQRCLDFVKENIIDNEHFDVSDTQLRELRMWLNEAVPNPNRNDFPDFIFNNGFIEHFAVTSSLENKKGSHQKKESKIFEEKSKKNFLYNLEKNGSDVSPGNP